MARNEDSFSSDSPEMLELTVEELKAVFGFDAFDRLTRYRATLSKSAATAAEGGPERSAGGSPPPCASLDEWLAALYAPWLRGDGPRERYGISLAKDPAAFNRVRRQLRLHWPRVCRRCGESFKPWRRGDRGRFITTVCQACREGGGPHAA
jgi:hypothetical protein